MLFGQSIYKKGKKHEKTHETNRSHLENAGTALLLQAEKGYNQMKGLYERENKQEVCDAILSALQTTRAAGTEGCNPLVELKYFTKENGTEIVRPIFEDGTGKDGYYDINVSCDSGIAIFIDITKQFICKMW